MSRAKLQPLGIDLGARRVRIAVAERTQEGSTFVRAVAARDLPSAESPADASQELAALVVEDILRELDVKKSECVAAIGAPDASLRAVRFPKMTHFERKRAAAFQVEVDGSEKRVTRLHPIDAAGELYAVASTWESKLSRVLGTLRKAGLRVVGVDHDGCALQRVFADLDAVVDIGYEVSRLHVFSTTVPSTSVTALGGMKITQGIAMDLSIDLESAERRKRILGLSGTSERILAESAQALIRLVKDARAGAHHATRIGMIGNAARIPGLADAVAQGCGMEVTLPVPSLLRSAAISDDVLRMAAPDWSLAAALTTWGKAA